MNVASETDSVLFSGNIYSRLFANHDGSASKAIPFTADLSTDSAQFHLDASLLSQETLPLGCGEFRVLSNGSQSMHVSAPLTRNIFELTILQGILSLPRLSEGFDLTLNQLCIDPDSVSIPDINLASGNEQVLSLFGTDITVNGISFNIPSPDLLELHLKGSMLLFGKDIGFSDLTVTTDCALANANLTVNPVDLIEESLSLDSLRIRNSNLYVYGMFTAFRPFDNLGSLYTIRIDTEGNWLDPQGNKLAAKSINILTGESPADAGISLGMAPLNVVCKLADVNLSFNGPSNKEASGHIDIDINSYWPTAFEDDIKIPIMGSLSFPETDGSQDNWLINETSVSVITLADLLNLEMNNISVQKDSVFAISLGGNFSLNLPSAQQDQGGGGEFKDFLLKEGTFEFGQVVNVNIDISGVNVQVSRLAFGFDLRNLATYDIKFDNNEASLENTTVNHNGFYLVFGGSISSELYGFDGGIDSLLVFKSTDRFYTLIKNAHFSYSDMIDGSLDLVLDVGLDEVDFQFLIGGHLDVSDIGFAAVGEISYKSTTLGGSTFMSPGFGLFLGVKSGLNITLAPLPITIEGAGLGIFFNADSRVEELVRSHLGFENDTADDSFFDAYNEYKSNYAEIMTFLEIYAYGSISIPEQAIMEAQVLFTLATDKVRLDLKVNVLGNEEFKKYCELGGSGFIEAGIPQDFSDWPYAAGNITIGMNAKDQTGVDLISMPTPGATEGQVEFFVLKNNWALHGSIQANFVNAFETNFEFFIGPPGFLVNAGMSYSFDAVVVKVEIGMGVSLWYVWEAPTEWGGYGQAWVQATCISEAFAGVRGELGAALVGEPDFYIYGYAELTAWFLDLEWSKCVWVEWRDGDIDGGIGGDSRMQEIIAQASEVSDRIMGQVDTIQDDIAESKRNAFTQLSPHDIKNIISTLRSGQADFYWNDLKEDANAVINSLDYYMTYVSGEDKTYVQSCKTVFVNYKNELIQAFNPDKLEELNAALDEYTEAVENMNTALAGKVAEYQGMYESLGTQIQQNSFALDSLLAFSDIEGSPIENPLQLSMSEGGIPDFSVDRARTKDNQENTAKLQQSFDTWLINVLDKLETMERLRTQLYAGFGPGSKISDIQGEFIASLLKADIMGTALLEKMSEFHDFYLTRKDRCDNLYYQNINEFNNVFRFSRWNPAIGDNNQQFINEAVKRRYDALKALAGGSINIDPGSIDSWLASEELATAFYSIVPFLFYDFTLTKMDSLYNAMVPAYDQAFWARNEIHRDFTLQTDGIWNKYAEISENLYNFYDTLIDEVKAYEKTYATSAPVSSEELKNRMDALSDEFSLTDLSGFSADITDPQKRYTPISADFSWTGSEEISEYAFSIAKGGTNQFQSIGDLNQFSLDFFLPVTWPPVQKQVNVRTRVRNKAGYEVAGQVVDIDLEKSINQSSSSIRKTTPYTSDDYVIASVNFPDNYAGKGVNVFKNSGSQIHVDWDVNTSKGPSPFAEYRYQVYQQNSPGNPVVNWTSTGTLSEATIRDLRLNANTSSPYIVKVAGYDAEGTVRCTRESPPLYINQTAPHFPDDIQMQIIRPSGENRVVFQGKQARDWFSDENSRPGLYVRIDTLAAYQYKLYYENQNPDSVSWQTIDGYALPQYDHHAYKTGDAVHIDLGVFPYKADTKLALRARNLHAATDNGFGPVKTVDLPRQEDETPPLAPSFDIAGKDENGNILLNIVSPARDPESGIAGYQYRLVNYNNNQRSIRRFPRNALQVDFPADSVYPGKKLTIPLNHDSLNVRGMWVGVYLAGVNYSGARGGSDVDFIGFPPDKPELNASLQHMSIPGSDPYTILKFAINTDQHPADFSVNLKLGTTLNGSDIESVSYMFGPGYRNALENSIRLPDSLTFSSPIYVTARSVSRMLNNHRERSDSVSVFLMTPDPPMFTEVTQNEQGYLVIPISSPAFNGRTPASYQFEIQNSFRENQTVARAFPLDPLQADFSNDQIQAGEQLQLPVLAKDMAPTLRVKLKAYSADGNVAINEVRYTPVPPLPRINGSITRHSLSKDYVLRLQGYWTDAIMQKNSSIKVFIGSEKGSNDISEKSLYNAVSYGKQGYNIFNLPEDVGDYQELYLSARNVTAAGQKSASFDTVLSVPPPLMFDQVAKNEQDNLMIHMLSSGFAPDVNVAGYQFAVFINDETKTPIRPFPASLSEFDFTPQQVIFGENLELPVHMSELPLQKLVLVILKAISTTGETSTHQIGYMPYPPIPVTAFIARDDQLKFQGKFENSYLFGGQLTLHFALGSFPGGDDILKGQFSLGTGGYYNASFSLSDVQVGEYYHLSSWYLKNNRKSGVYQKQLTVPCEPMFVEIRQQDDQSLSLPIVSTGFNGDPELKGYQFAVGSASGQYDVRPFPASETMDFTPDQVQTGRNFDPPAADPGPAGEMFCRTQSRAL
ncbi:MAG: hypothetical protein U5R06_15680 [candidate division KSB1 bacterium]|nr:hypothetical protein [candidate division KSB1 bacterium]